MRYVLALAVALWAGPVAAQEAVACLQSQLNALGFDPGPVDGTMRPSVRDAGRAWSAGRDLPELRRRTAATWCRTVGLAHPDLQKYWPNRALPQLVRAPDPSGAAVLRQADDAVRAYFRDTYQIELAARAALIGASDGTFFDSALSRVLTDMGRMDRPKPVDIERLCRDGKIGGAANRGYMVFCWPKADETPEWQSRIGPDLRKVMAHEFTHQVQYALASDDPARRGADDWHLGPHWMVEGVAELVEWQFDTGTLRAEGTALFDLQSRARRSRLTLEDLTRNGSVNSPEAYGVARFAAYVLAQKYGIGAVFDYFSALADSDSQDAAFQQTFGLSLSDYSVVFEGLRRDYGAAQRYGREGP